MIRKKKQPTEFVIDLTGPQGNAYFLLGLAEDLCKRLGKSEEEYQSIYNEMTSGDYDNLITVIDKNFGHLVIFER